jgi:hypothetical protein
MASVRCGRRVQSDASEGHASEPSVKILRHGKGDEAQPAHFDLSLFMLPSYKGIRRVDESEAEQKAKEQQPLPVELA